MDIDDALAAKRRLLEVLNADMANAMLLESAETPRHRRAVAVGVADDGAGGHRAVVLVQDASAVPLAFQQRLRQLASDEVAVRTIGPVWAAVAIGASVSNRDRGAGTLGCQVFDRDSRAPLILSNDHVFGHTTSAAKGHPVISPGFEDGGVNGHDTIGTLFRSSDLMLDGRPNFVDAAVASLAPGIQITVPKLPGYRFDPGHPVAPIALHRVVAKIGRTTGLTFGRITALDIDKLEVDYRTGSARFDDQFEVSGIDGPFAAKGDSGALIVDPATGAAVGLLFAVNDEGRTYAHRLQPVLENMQATLF